MRAGEGGQSMCLGNACAMSCTAHFFWLLVLVKACGGARDLCMQSVRVRVSMLCGVSHHLRKCELIGGVDTVTLHPWEVTCFVDGLHRLLSRAGGGLTRCRSGLGGIMDNCLDLHALTLG